VRRCGDGLCALPQQQVFVKSDCTMLEVNPLAEDQNGHLLAADAKLNFDDNAEFRQKELFALRDTSQEVRPYLRSPPPHSVCVCVWVCVCECRVGPP
jgi:hypothetical protein